MTASRVVDLDGRRLLLTGLDLPIWPDESLTKEDLIAYDLDIADPLLPFLSQRPFSVMRCPGGAGTDCVFQKTAPPGLPSWVASRRIRGERTAVGHADYVVGSDRVARVHLVNIGAISSRATRSAAGSRRPAAVASTS
jgi:bifunctional non-homologous end joining protein LigD